MIETQMDEHKCTQNRFVDTIKVIYGPSIDNGWKDWILQVSHVASAKDVHDGEAETIGELCSQHEFIIYYCPFCGIELNAKK
jgi:hypothetical protein